MRATVTKKYARFRAIKAAPSRRVMATTIGIGVISLAVAACGSSSGSGSSSQTPAGGSSAGGGSAGVNAAKAALTKYKAIPTFTSPGSQLDGKSIAAGKTVLVIPYSSTIQYNVAFADAIKKADDAVGFKTTIYSDDGTPTSWAAGINLGISQHVAVIDLIAGLDVEQIKPQIQAATKAGIAVVGSTYNDASQPTPSYLTTDVPLGYAQAGRLEADQAIADTNGKADVIVITSSGLNASTAMTPGVQQEFKSQCPSCTVHVIDVPVTQWATQITPQVESTIASDPNVNYVLPNYDSEAQYVIAALTAKGVENKVGIATFNGTPAPMALVASGKMTMDVGENIAWAGYATTDANLRSIGQTNKPAVTIDEHIPLRVFDKTNIADAGNPPNLSSGYGDAEQGYLKVWGLA